jgi:hypothetical protein
MLIQDFVVAAAVVVEEEECFHYFQDLDGSRYFFLQLVALADYFFY